MATKSQSDVNRTSTLCKSLPNKTAEIILRKRRLREKHLKLYIINISYLVIYQLANEQLT